jgi:hypothetical protein
VELLFPPHLAQTQTAPENPGIAPGVRYQVKLLVTALVSSGLLSVMFSLAATSARVSTAPAPKLNALQFCLSGGVELVDERCTSTGRCARQSVRLAWNRGEGTLYEGDSTGEKALRPVSGSEWSHLVADLTSLDALETDSDRWCGSPDCAGAERALTITTDCSGSGWTTTFLRARPVWQRVRAAGADRRSSDVQCLAMNAWQATFATHLASRFETTFHQLRDAGRSK